MSLCISSSSYRDDSHLIQGHCNPVWPLQKVQSKQILISEVLVRHGFGGTLLNPLYSLFDIFLDYVLISLLFSSSHPPVECQLPDTRNIIYLYIQWEFTKFLTSKWRSNDCNLCSWGSQTHAIWGISLIPLVLIPGKMKISLCMLSLSITVSDCKLISCPSAFHIVFWSLESVSPSISVLEMWQITFLSM